MIFWLVALLGAVASGTPNSNCQYLYDEGWVADTPMAIGSCNIYWEHGNAYSFIVQCVNETLAAITAYSSLDCSGSLVYQQLYEYSNPHSNFDCTSTSPTCAQDFTAYQPCNCTLELGNCDYYIKTAIPDGVCSTSNYPWTSVKWDFSCGVGSEFVLQKDFNTTDCSGPLLSESLYENGFCNPNISYTWGIPGTAFSVCSTIQYPSTTPISLIASTTDMSTTDMSTTDMSTTDMSTTDMLTTPIPGDGGAANSATIAMSSLPLLLLLAVVPFLL